MPIQTCEFPNYCAIVVAVGKDSVSVCAQFEIFVFKLGPLAKIKLIYMRNGFSTINCEKSCQRPTEVFLFSKYHCTTLTVDLELDVSVCAHL